MLFAADVAKTQSSVLTSRYWSELGEPTLDEATREFANNLAVGTLREIEKTDETIRTRAEHWRIERMAIVDRNVLRLAVYEFLFTDTPHTVVINEALEIARRFSTFEATQFINGILDAIKHDLEKNSAPENTEENSIEKTRASSH
jgi:N utilization substance protein B